MAAMPKRKWAKKAGDIPEEEHYVILEFSLTDVPGDERSREAPGHGYPAHTMSQVDYTIYESKEEWEQEIAVRTKRNDDDFKAIVVKPIKPKVEVIVDIPK